MQTLQARALCTGGGLQMIRYQADYAFGDAHAFFTHDRLDGFSNWIDDAAAAFASVELSQSAVRMIGRRWGPVSEGEALAIGWIIGLAMDLTRERERLGARMSSQRAFEIAWEDTKATCINTGVGRLYNLPNHALPQLAVMAKHIHQNHF